MIRLYLLVLALLINYQLCFAAEIWNYIPTIHFTNNDVAIKIECIDSCDCILASAYATSLCRLLQTTDAGNTWEEIYTEAKTPPYPKPYYFRNMKYISRNNIYIVYEDGYIKHTVNNGKNWDTIRISGDYNIGQGLKHFSMSDSLNGMVCDVFGSFITNDGWKTFEFIKKPIAYYINDCWMFSRDTFAIIGNILPSAANSPRGSIFSITYDRGKSWKIDSIGDYDYLSSIYFLDKNNGWITGSKPNNLGDCEYDIVYRTTNGGKKWERIYNKENEPYFGLQDINFNDSLNGIAVGQFGKILRTSDGGNNWIRDYLGKCPYSSQNIPPTMCVAYAGRTPIIGTYGNGIYVLKNISNLEVPSTIEFILSPNPASDFITINLQPSEGFNPSEGSEVEIYDMVGVKVISEPIHPMTSSHRMNVEKLPAGLYFIKIGDRVKKFVKMRV